MSARLIQLETPHNIISFRGGCASVVLMPCARELTDDEKRCILASRRQRVFVYSCADAPLPAGLSKPVTLEDFPIESLRWAIGRATLLNVGILDFRKDGVQTDLSSVLLELDDRSGSSDHPFVVTLISDHPFDVGDYSAMHRPGLPFELPAAIPFAPSRFNSGNAKG